MTGHHDGRNYPRDALEHYRFQAIKLRKQHWQVKEIAEAFDLHPASVSRWFVRVKKGGETSLNRTKAKGANPKLGESHRMEILCWLRQPATNFGFETPLWTCRRIQQLAQKKCGVNIHLSNIWVWLCKWNLTNQKPEKRALQSDPKEAKKWLMCEWPKIKMHAKRWQAIIYFVDESGVSLIPVMGKTWAPKGKTPIVKVAGNKGGFCVTSAISPAGRMLFRIEKETVNAGVHIQFLKQILNHHPRRKIIVVEDNAPPHTSNEVKQFVEEHNKRFALYYLPTYSPHLNPDEEVWNHLKNHKLKAHQARTKKEFKPLLTSKLRSIQMNGPLIRSFFYRMDLT